MFEIAQNIINQHSGAKFLNIDLHIHTPASNDWDMKNPEPEFHSSKVTPKDFVDYAINAGLDLIAITDHNSVEWCPGIIKESERTNLTVLPGFELTVNPGVHILAIFDKDKPIDELRDLLIKLGINRENFGDSRQMTTNSLTDKGYSVIRELEKNGALVIPAHIEIESGVIGRLRGGQAAKDFLTNSGCRILELNSENIPPSVEEMLRIDDRRFTLIRSSDSHRLDKIGYKSTLVKLDSRSVRGLKQVAFEPQSRVKYLSEKANAKPRIIGMYSDGGVFKDQYIKLNRDLNCVIGGRGAGKSALLDFLRFVLGEEPDDLDFKQKFLKRLNDLVGNLTTVYVLVEEKEELWLYSRKLRIELITNRGKSSLENHSEEAQVHQIFLDSKEAISFGIRETKFEVEFFSQGEVQSLTNSSDSARRLKLVDNFIQANLKEPKIKINNLKENISRKNAEILSLEKRIEDGETELLNLPKHQKRITELEASLNNPVLTSHQDWNSANQWINICEEKLGKVKSDLEKIELFIFDEREFSLSSLDGKGKVTDSREKKTQDILTQYLNILREAKASLDKNLENLKTESNNYAAKLKSLKIQWKDELDAEVNDYERALREQGVSNLAALNQELTKLRVEAKRLTEVVEPQIKSFKESRRKLVLERDKELDSLHKEQEQITERRKMACKVMTRKLDSTVKISISDQKEADEYYNLLEKIVPSGTRNELINKVVSEIEISKFTRLLHDEDAKGFEELGFNENAIGRFFRISPEDIRRLELIDCNDIVNIELKVDGVYKDLSSLSDGEKCSAILSIVLLDQSRPLIIDQPEDELDHDFIMSNVVETLLRVKKSCDSIDRTFKPECGRQFIIATHNQNIPVLGDAELVIRMKKNSEENTCVPVSSKGIDNPDSLDHILSLEGGLVAFERRREKYQSYSP